MLWLDRLRANPAGLTHIGPMDAIWATRAKAVHALCVATQVFVVLQPPPTSCLCQLPALDGPAAAADPDSCAASMPYVVQGARARRGALGRAHERVLGCGTSGYTGGVVGTGQ